MNGWCIGFDKSNVSRDNYELRIFVRALGSIKYGGGKKTTR